MHVNNGPLQCFHVRSVQVSSSVIGRPGLSGGCRGGADNLGGSSMSLALSGLRGVRADHSGIEVFAAILVLQNQRNFAVRERVIAPTQHRDQRTGASLPLSVSGYSYRSGRSWYYGAETFSPPQSIKPIRKNVSAMLACFADRQNVGCRRGLRIITKLQRSPITFSVWKKPNSACHGRVRSDRKAVGCASVNDGVTPAPGPRVINGFDIDLFLALRAGHHRPAHFAAKIVDEVDRRLGGFLNHLSPRARRSHHYWIEIHAHRRETIFEALGALRISHVPEQALCGEHAQPLRKRRARNSECRLKCLEMSSGKIAFRSTRNAQLSLRIATVRPTEQLRS